MTDEKIVEMFWARDERALNEAQEKYNALKASREGEKKAIEEKLAVLAKDVEADVMERYKINHSAKNVCSRGERDPK